ncbi:MAG: helix-turn-helix transcriptional regulator, partial [Sulfuriferula sp.]
MSLDESAIDTLSVGEQLQQARTAMQLGITDVAQHLKLSALQIERLENNDFSALGLVFSRGFVRQYARLVGLDADTLVAAMTGNTQQQAESISVHNEQIPLSQG